MKIYILRTQTKNSSQKLHIWNERIWLSNCLETYPMIHREKYFLSKIWRITTSALKLFINASRPKTKEQFQSLNMCLQSSFAFFYVNFLCLLVKDNDKFLNQPTARSLLSNAKPRLHFYISIILLLHQFFAKMHGYNFNIKEPIFMRRTPTFNIIWLCFWSLLHDLVLNIIIR